MHEIERTKQHSIWLPRKTIIARLSKSLKTPESELRNANRTEQNKVLPFISTFDSSNH